MHFDTDGAGSNLRCLAKRFAELRSHRICALHHTKLIETSCLSALDLRIVASIYSLALLFRMGGSFLRRSVMTERHHTQKLNICWPTVREHRLPRQQSQLLEPLDKARVVHQKKTLVGGTLDFLSWVEVMEYEHHMGQRASTRLE